MRRTSRKVCWPLSTCLVVTLAACTSSGRSDQGAAHEPGPTASSKAIPSAPPSIDGSAPEPCTAPVDVLPEPPAGYRLVGEDVAVPDRAVLQAQESGEADPAARLFAKWGLVVRGGAVIDLRVAPGWEDRARVGWGSATVPAVTAHIRACAPVGAEPRWLAFVGGTWVARAACLPLTIRSRGQAVQVRLGVGISCESTDPPRS
ncbi:hypothetical protein ACIBPB_32035 [Micromonospora sp. NPDC049836]|uniref:hypothetical protein n=1 Tax=Micromonospora sp. NPDC049836 TaxID=3364274 RepID=UPI0037ACBCAA